MLSMVEIGERAGSSMDKIHGGWSWAGYDEPCHEVIYNPDRTVLTLPLTPREKSAASAKPLERIMNEIDG